MNKLFDVKANRQSKKFDCRFFNFRKTRPVHLAEKRKNLNPPTLISKIQLKTPVFH